MPVSQNQNRAVARLLEKHLDWVIEGDLPPQIVDHALNMQRKKLAETTIAKAVGIQLERNFGECFVEDKSAEEASTVEDQS